MQTLNKTYKQILNQTLYNDWNNDAYICLATCNDMEG